MNEWSLRMQKCRINNKANSNTDNPTSIAYIRTFSSVKCDDHREKYRLFPCAYVHTCSGRAVARNLRPSKKKKNFCSHHHDAIEKCFSSSLSFLSCRCQIPHGVTIVPWDRCLLLVYLSEFSCFFFSNPCWREWRAANSPLSCDIPSENKIPSTSALHRWNPWMSSQISLQRYEMHLGVVCFVCFGDEYLR